MLLVGGLVVAVASLVGWSVLDRYYSAKQNKLDRGSGFIDQVTENGGDSNAGTIAITYTDQGRTGFATVHVDDASDYSAGETVTVLVDPRDRGDVTVPGENYLPDWVPMLPFVAMAGAALALSGGALLAAVHRRGRSVRAHAWQRRSVRTCEFGKGEGKTTLLFVEEPDRSLSTYSVTRASRGLPKHTVWRAEVAGTESAVFRRTESDDLHLAKRLSNTPFHAEMTMLRYASQPDDDGVTLGLTLLDEIELYRLEFVYAETPADVLTVQDAPAFDVMTLRAGYAMLKPVDGEGWLFGRRVPKREARKKWRALVSSAGTVTAES
jgi:hypothetical protein